MTRRFHRVRSVLERTPLQPLLPRMTHVAARALDLSTWWSAPGMLANAARLGAFHDRHRGERCFILGNGPSLKKTDLSKLRGETTFGLNRIYLLFEEMGFTTTYLTVVNRLVIEQCAEDFANVTPPLFVSMAGRDHLSPSDGTMFLDTRRYDPGFQPNATARIWEGGTVTYVAMQLAYYMGFSEVILIGVDHYFPNASGPAHKEVVSTGDDANHFSTEYFGKGFRWQLPDLAMSEVAYTLARYAFERDGRRIVDATVGGHLRVFERVDYAGLFPGP